MRDVLRDWDRMTADGSPVGRAVVTKVWGSAPRPAGACLLADAHGNIAGSVSGGCVESAAAEEITAYRASRFTFDSFWAGNWFGSTRSPASAAAIKNFAASQAF